MRCRTNRNTNANANVNLNLISVFVLVFVLVLDDSSLSMLHIDSASARHGSSKLGPALA